MDIETLAKHLDVSVQIAARAAINLLRRGLIEPGEGTVDEAIADLEERLAPAT